VARFIVVVVVVVFLVNSKKTNNSRDNRQQAKVYQPRIATNPSLEVPRARRSHTHTGKV